MITIQEDLPSSKTKLVTRNNAEEIWGSYGSYAYESDGTKLKLIKGKLPLQLSTSLGNQQNFKLVHTEPNGVGYYEQLNSSSNTSLRIFW
jgi:hypothetical protein